MKVDQNIIDNMLKDWVGLERMVEIPFVFEQLPEPPAKVLDVGCCYSSFLDVLGRLGFDNWGIDVQNCFDTFIRFKKADARMMPFGDNEFDVVTCISALEHFGLVKTPYKTDKKEDKTADRKALSEMLRVVRVGGIIILTLPYGDGSKELKDWIKFYDKIKIGELFSGFNFRIIREEYHQNIPNARQKNQMTWETSSEINTSRSFSEKQVDGNVCFVLQKI